MSKRTDEELLREVDRRVKAEQDKRRPKRWMSRPNDAECGKHNEVLCYADNGEMVSGVAPKRATRWEVYTKHVPKGPIGGRPYIVWCETWQREVFCDTGEPTGRETQRMA